MLHKKIKKILIGTNNKGKLKEIRGLLPKNIKTLSISKLGGIKVFAVISLLSISILCLQ